MQKLTIGRMAKLYGLHRSSLYEAVEKGRVSAGFDGKGQRVIDLSEMIRVYGEPPGKPEGTRQNPTPQADTDPTPDSNTQQAMLEELKAMRRELVALREEVAQLRALPAPGQLAPHDDHRPERPEKPPEATQAPTPADDDPHGFKSLIRSLRESE